MIQSIESQVSGTTVQMSVNYLTHVFSRHACGPLVLQSFKTLIYSDTAQT